MSVHMSQDLPHHSAKAILALVRLEAVAARAARRQPENTSGQTKWRAKAVEGWVAHVDEEVGAVAVHRLQVNIAAEVPRV